MRRPRPGLCSTRPQDRWPSRRAVRSPTMRAPLPCSTWPSTTASSRRSPRSITTTSGVPRLRFATVIRTAIGRTESDMTFVPFILTPCFPSYPSNHASGSYGGAEVLRRIYGAGGHPIELSNPRPRPDAAIHQVQGDHRRYRRRACLWRHPFPIRPGSGGAAGTRVSQIRSTATTCSAITDREHDREEDCDDEHDRNRSDGIRK